MGDRLLRFADRTDAELKAPLHFKEGLVDYCFMIILGFMTSLTPSISQNTLQGKALSKAARRLIPFLFCLYLLAYLDRINVSFAQLQMREELGFSDAVYGFGASVFFIGFTLFEVPSNLILQHVGARWWIARIMLTWGLISSGMALIETPTHFYVMRFALGAAEAGFFPGIVLYLSYWFPDEYRARVISVFMTATAVAGVIGAPVSGLLLKLHGLAGLDGWQWLFLAEGIPSISAGLAVFFFLPNSPTDARWLSALERDSIINLLTVEAKHSPKIIGVKKMLTSQFFWRLGLLYLSVILMFNSLSLWLPQIIKSITRFDNVSTAFLTALPFFVAAIAMVLNGIHSDRTGERRLHIVVPGCLGALSLLFAVAMARYPQLQIVGLCISAAGVWSTLGPFWTLTTSVLQGKNAAVGFALVNSIGAFGGFLGPNFIGLCKTYFGGFDVALVSLAIILLVGCAQLSRGNEEFIKNKRQSSQ